MNSEKGVYFDEQVKLVLDLDFVHMLGVFGMYVDRFNF